MFIASTSLMFLAVAISCNLASPTSQIDEVRDLLEELRGMTLENDGLDSAVSDIVERVYSPDIHTRMTRDQQGRDCGDGYTASCDHKRCDQGSCYAMCDAQKLGEDYKEKYVCNCKPGYTAAYCNVRKSDKATLCKQQCPKSARCYMFKQSKSGVFCYDKDWNLDNPNDKITEKSLREISEMGMFAELVEGIMKRNLGNN